jgi:hypothetical protein
MPVLWKLTLLAATVIGLMVWAWPRAEARGPVSAGPGGAWLREPAAIGAGFKPGRELIVYRASPKVSDYRLEFDWNPDSKGVGWVFRASDASNYSAARLDLARRRSSQLTAEHFTVSNGKDSQHVRKVVTLAGNSPSIRVRMDVVASAFTITVQGNIVDSWTDKSFVGGDIGFYKEGNESPSIQTVQLSFFNSPIPDYKGAFATLLRSQPPSGAVTGAVR